VLILQENVVKLSKQLPTPRYIDREKSEHHLVIADIDVKGLTISYRGSATFFSSSSSKASMFRSNAPVPLFVKVYYFEMVVNAGGENGAIGIGFVPEYHSMEGMPGWDKGSCGYHGDDGLKFCEKFLGHGKIYGPTYTKGDIVGCGYDSKKRNRIFYKEWCLFRASIFSI